MMSLPPLARDFMLYSAERKWESRPHRLRRSSRSGRPSSFEVLAAFPRPSCLFRVGHSSQCFRPPTRQSTEFVRSGKILESKMMIYPNSRQDAADVALHYDQLDAVYRQIWGEHVHHGLWQSGRE